MPEDQRVVYTVEDPKTRTVTSDELLKLCAENPLQDIREEDICEESESAFWIICQSTIYTLSGVKVFIYVTKNPLHQAPSIRASGSKLRCSLHHRPVRLTNFSWFDRVLPAQAGLTDDTLSACFPSWLV
ncbi:hypothetical protein GUJ93_ZPchr0010g7274 [Zizania palustris]|uniref:Uncharacterized protein n=1 Tax=Zizania palustris TaxID=103762 RepID=A0A8J5WGL3_ZIZPA|nr:hypothetical protein GUJ93_ZPchr0010g7274 [Zizania palustris]